MKNFKWIAAALLVTAMNMAEGQAATQLQVAQSAQAGGQGQDRLPGMSSQKPSGTPKKELERQPPLQPPVRPPPRRTQNTDSNFLLGPGCAPPPCNTD